MYRIDSEWADGKITTERAGTPKAWLEKSNNSMKAGAVSVYVYKKDVLLSSWVLVDGTCQWQAGNPNFDPTEVYGSDPVVGA